MNEIFDDICLYYYKLIYAKAETILTYFLDNYVLIFKKRHNSLYKF